MTKKRSTKRSLLASILALCLCFASFAGTTFAWFTDQVTSANNIITSGNLDIELYYQLKDEDTWTKVTEATNVFKEDTLWEPGHTEIVKLKVVNEGSLALKYNLGVNVASEVGSVNVNDKPFKLSDFIKFGIVDGAQSYTRDQAIAAAEANGATALKTAYNSGSTALEAKNDGNTDEKIVTMVVYMPTTVGNEANFKKGAAVPTIHLGINLMATQMTAESDSFDNQYDANAMTYVKDTAEAQAALDAAVPGTVIKLLPGASYGTLYLRPYAGAAATKVVDWIGNNYGWETYTLFEDVTIVGASGATVDAIEIEGGTYYHTEHSQAATYPVMLSLVELKNVVIDGVTFTGKGGYDPQGYGNAINLAGNNIKVNGLTLKNCVLENEGNNARLLYKTEATTHVHTYAYEGVEYTFVGNLKDITVTGCTFNGGYMGLELRETENLTITNNTFNVADRNILLPTNTGCTYSGNITITGNVSNNAKERFVRADGMGDAVVVIKDNTLNTYMGADDDFIKVTNANNVTIEGNTLTSIGVVDAVAAQRALDNAVAGTVIQLLPGVNYGTLYLRPVDGSANTTTDCDKTIYRTEFLRTVENLTIVGAPGATVDAIQVVSGHVVASTCNLVEIKNLVIDSVEFNDTHVNPPHSYAAPLFVDLSYADIDGLTVKNCKLIGDNDKMNFVYIYSSGKVAFDNVAENIAIIGNTVDGIARLCELRQTENVTIANNTISNTALHGMLLTVSGGTYSGNVTITGNTAVGINERFVRMAGAGDANVVIKDNTILNYEGEDADYIKVTDSNGTPVIENNVVGRSVYGLTLIPNGENSKIIVNDKEGFLNLTKLFADWRELFTDGNGNEFNNYANGAGADYYYGGYWTISLEADIDLNNATIAPVTINHPVSAGDPTFDGNNHTIKNAKIVADAAAENMTGLFNVSHEAFKNLKLDNIHVTGSNVGNSSAGILAGSCHGRIDNITITNSSVTGGKYTGGVVGYGYTDISNCTLTNVTVKGGYKLGGIIGYICASNGTGDVTGNTLDKCTVDGIGNGIFAGGKTEYVIGQVVGNYDCNGTCNNNTVTNMTSSATAAIGKIEAGKTVTQ